MLEAVRKHPPLRSDIVPVDTHVAVHLQTPTDKRHLEELRLGHSLEMEEGPVDDRDVEKRLVVGHHDIGLLAIHFLPSFHL